CVLLVVGGGGYALWETGLAGRAWNGATSLLGTVFGREVAPATDAVASVVAAQEEPQARPASLRPPTVSAAVAIPVPESSRPAPAADGVLRLAVADVAATPQPSSEPAAPAAARSVPAAPAAPVDTAASAAGDTPAAPVRTASSAEVQAHMQAQAMQRSQQAVQVQPEPAQPEPAQPEPTQRAVASADIAPTPVLSDAKAQLRVVDQMLASDPAEALRRVEDVLSMPMLQPDDAAEAGYRKGYAARMLRDEATAEKAWRETADRYPELRGGRFSALALADTWFHRYAGDRPQISYWDDIQILYSRVLGQDDAPFLPEAVKSQVKTKLNRINDMVIFGTAPSKLARYHKVASGEFLSSIGNKYRVDYESISRINGIDPNRIRVGMDLKLVVGDVSIVVRKNEHDPAKTPTVTWYLDGRWIREYQACVGDGNKTPAGVYHLTSKERDPSWTNPANGQLLPNNHPENILGSRWMAMKGMNTQGLGIHGTTVDDSIPGYTSAGCVRLLNKNVEELFSFARIDNRVTVLD
ncbi:MAG: L,D-transpeptidase family protein, partial [Planctomycetaceae bacterium]|nr:L,D-transpeptidase family protein [Planctomycetaceae bacterium]